MTKDDIKKEIDKLLNYNAAKQILSLNNNTLERAYEAYIWSLCKRAVEEAGGTAELVGRDGKPAKNIILRGAPGHMASNAQNFCYIKCGLNTKEFEIHLDVQYEGNSGVLHEVDVSIYDHADAKNVRGFISQPKASKLIVMIECKFYQANPPSIALGRQFVGLVSDFAGRKMNAFVSNRGTQSLNRFLASKGNIEPFTDLIPGDQAAERFVKNLEQVLRKWSM